jgi:RNA polymerase sigma factor (sigma-70 family)
MSDQELIAQFCAQRSENAFAEIVRRHVDHVHSAAMRMVRDPHLAEDITQAAFVALARSAGNLQNVAVLSSWLHGTVKNLSSSAIRCETRRRRREQEAIAMTGLQDTENNADWEATAPHLDAALHAMRAEDRDPLMLRFFERKTAREIAAALKINEEAAQKRVSRALERLREILARRGVKVGAAGLCATLTANAVQAAPIGLSAGVLAGAKLLASSSLTTSLIGQTKVIAMTALQKTMVTAGIVAAVGGGIYGVNKNLQLRHELTAAQQDRDAVEQELQATTNQRDEASKQLAALQQDVAQLREQTASIPKLRGEITRLQAARTREAAAAAYAEDPFTKSVLSLTDRAFELYQHLLKMPERSIPELHLLNENDWLQAVSDADLSDESGVRKALAKLRSLAKSRFATQTSSALTKYIEAHEGKLPDAMSDLKPYFTKPVDDAALQRYDMLFTGHANDLPKDSWVITEKAPVDRDFDSHTYVAPYGRTGSYGTGKGSIGDPDAGWATRPSNTTGPIH